VGTDLKVGHYNRGVEAWGRARRQSRAMRRLTVSGRRNPARREWDRDAMTPTSQGRTPPPNPPALKKRELNQVESSRYTCASQVTKIGYWGAHPKPAMPEPIKRKS
jgi:hypothetical protein